MVVLYSFPAFDPGIGEINAGFLGSEGLRQPHSALLRLGLSLFGVELPRLEAAIDWIVSYSMGVGRCRYHTTLG